MESVHQPRSREAAQSYTIVDARPVGEAGDPVFAQVARDVQTALSSKGMYAAPEGASPQLVVEVDYGVSAPILKEYVRSEPIYIASTRPASLIGGNNHAGMEPRYFGMSESIFHVRKYEKFLRITAREFASPDARLPGREVWSLFVTNDDTSDDLPRYVRLMVAAAMDDISRDLGPGRRVVLTAGDGRVVFIEKGLAEAAAVTAM